MSGTRNVFIMSAAVFALIAGEQLWTRFLPVYLVTLGAPAVANSRPRNIHSHEGDTQ